MAFNKLFEKFTGNNQEETGYEELADETVASKVVRKDNTMILLEPRAYSESQQIADYLKTNS